MSTIPRDLLRGLDRAILCLPVALLVTLTGCSATSTSGSSSATGSSGGMEAPVPAAQVRAGGSAVRWVCDDGTALLVEQAEEESALVVWDGETRPLVRLPSASGARYGDGTVELRMRGEEALLEVAGEARRACRVEGDGEADREATPSEPLEPSEPSEPMDPGPWNRAQAEGVDFRGIGQEPGWILEIWEGERMVMEADYGTRTVELPAAERTETAQGVRFRAEGQGHRLTALLEEEPCSDTMSGERFDHSVTVTLDGDTYRGCGRWLP